MGYHFYFINKIFALLGLDHFAHEFQHVNHTWLVMVLIIGGSILICKNLTVIPSGRQNVLELIVTKLEQFVIAITGYKGQFLAPYISTVFLFILISNLLGLVPGFFSPTANLNTTLALAICTFCYTHTIGVKQHGIKYLKQFVGPVLWLSPLMIPIEIIGHFSRVLSLSIRLFGNIFGKESVIGILFVLAGMYFAPLPVLFLGILFSFIQALVFSLLSMIYFSMAMEDAH